jgi:hypothetical protein
MRHILLIVLLALTAGCSSLGYLTYATRTGVPRAEIEDVANAAVRRYKMLVVDVQKTAAGELTIYLGKRKDSQSGLLVIYQKINGVWVEVEMPTGVHRVWTRSAKNEPNQPLEHNAYVHHARCEAAVTPAIVMAHL